MFSLAITFEATPNQMNVKKATIQCYFHVDLQTGYYFTFNTCLLKTHLIKAILLKNEYCSVYDFFGALDTEHLS